MGATKTDHFTDEQNEIGRLPEDDMPQEFFPTQCRFFGMGKLPSTD